jgi:hypothetical protein
MTMRKYGPMMGVALIGALSSGCWALLPATRPQGKECEGFFMVARKPIGGGVAELASWGAGNTSYYAECPANGKVDPDALRAWSNGPYGTMGPHRSKVVPLSSKVEKEWDGWVDVNGRNVQFHFTGYSIITNGCAFWVNMGGKCSPLGDGKAGAN